MAEASYLPDCMIRRGIRWMLRDRLRGLEQTDPEAAQRMFAVFIDELRHEKEPRDESRESAARGAFSPGAR